MKLHQTPKLLQQTIRATSQHTGIKQEFIEKDYWITFVLFQLSQSDYAPFTVFKGGTSLSKGYHLINRFSEDIDIAILDYNIKTANQKKSLIRSVEKTMTNGLTELSMEGVSSKGSRFRKSVFEYPYSENSAAGNKLILEINSFANPYPFERLAINTFIYDFLSRTGKHSLINEYGLHHFELKVLSKEQTLIEKLASLIRFSLTDNYVASLSTKLRHFYDLYFLLLDPTCSAFVRESSLRNQINKVILHDKTIFDDPTDWQAKSLTDSKLLTNFNETWLHLKDKYTIELSALAFAPIPNEKDIASSFQALIPLLV